MHNLATGPSFFADHDALSDFYTAAAFDYDTVVERMIGLGQDVDLPKIPSKAAENIAKLPVSESNNHALELILALEKSLCREVEKEVASSVSEGTKQLIGEIANKSEGRQYLLGQRLK